MTEAIERVVMERRRRGWSIRQAAGAGAISNTTWGLMERTGDVSRSMHLAVMRAFDWPPTWQESPPPATEIPADEAAALRQEISELRGQLTATLEAVVDLVDELRRRDAAGGHHPTGDHRPPRAVGG